MYGIIKLVSFEGDCFLVSSKVLEVSPFLEEAPDHDEIHLAPLEVDSKTLRTILVYLQHYNFELPPFKSEFLTSNDLKTTTHVWDAQFIESLDEEEFLKFILAVNKLDISHLVKLSCFRIANEVRLKSLEELESVYQVSVGTNCEDYLSKVYDWAKY